jgi:transcription initiation factor TFIID subunit TAF12
MYDVWEGWAKGVPEQIDQHFSDDFVGVRANGWEATRWTVAVVEIKQVKELDKNAINSAEKWRNNPSWQQAQEVLHIDVQNNHAIVVNEQWMSQPDSTKQITKEVTWQTESISKIAWCANPPGVCAALPNVPIRRMLSTPFPVTLAVRLSAYRPVE